ncbi:hypothetical protein CC79DRAFT_1370782 [Sarocladium strictum]
MLASLVLHILGYGAIVYCQKTSDPATDRTTQQSPTSTVTNTGTTHTIAVGASGHKFTPGETKAKVGDTIEFKFYPLDHWVIRGDFDYPCIPYEYIGTDRRGFSSGEQPVQAITDDGPKFRVRVNDTAPIYFYCGAPGSCVRYHMMGVANPTRNGTLDDWQENAKDVDFQLRPGDPWPSEAEQPTEIPTDSSDPPANTDSEQDAEDQKDFDSGLGAGAIAGIVVGTVAGLIIIAIIAFFCLRRRGFSITRRHDRQPPVSQLVRTQPGDSSGQAHPSMIFDDSSRQKSPYRQSQQSARGPYHYASPTTPPFSAVSYGSYYPPPPPSVSPQPHNGHDTLSPNSAALYHDHLQAHFTPHNQGVQHKPDHRSPVELPTDHGQVESSLPSYKDTRFSWAGAEAEYRPSKQPCND